MPDSPRLRAAAAGRFVTHQLMPSLRQLLGAHSPLLLLDAASARVQVGWLVAGQPDRWETAVAEAGVGLFECVQRLGIRTADAGAFLFCDGPGSILGVRTAAMALRTWLVLKPRPVFAYRSLELVAHALGRSELTIIADARRDSWHTARMDQPVRREPTAALSGELVMPEGFRNWTPLPAGVTSTSYSLDQLLPAAGDTDLFRETAAPDAFLHEEPSYVTWTPQIHRAP